VATYLGAVSNIRVGFRGLSELLIGDRLCFRLVAALGVDAQHADGSHYTNELALILE
jgi:hypothetical protein